MDQLIGNGSMAFLQSEDDDNSAVAVSTLAQAMAELGVVGIVRRVYSRATAPRLGVLAPEEDEAGGRYLAYVDLPFAEDRQDCQLVLKIQDCCKNGVVLMNYKACSFVVPTAVH